MELSADIATANDKPQSNLVAVPEEKRKGFEFGVIGTPTKTWLPWAVWATYHAALGQELAKRMREYPGPSTDDDGGDIGGTPVMMRMAA